MRLNFFQIVLLSVFQISMLTRILLKNEASVVLLRVIQGAAFWIILSKYPLT